MKTLILLISGFLPMLMSAQSVQRQVIASTGTQTVSVTGMQVSQTVGQPAVNSFSTSTFIVSEGFQQGPANPATGATELHDMASFVVFPNPVGGELSLQIESSQALSLEVTLRDVLGRETSVPATRLQVSGKTMTAIDCSDLATGSYLLMIRDLKSGSMESVKVQKIR